MIRCSSCAKFVPLERQVLGEPINGYACEPLGDELFHHTSIDNLASIRSSGELRPSQDKFGDGTVNFTGNPNWHRFGSLRLVFDRKKLDVTPMLYTEGENEKKRSKVENDIYRRSCLKAKAPSSNRIANKILGAEPMVVYGSECKHFSRRPVPIKSALKAVEYWIPWHPGRSEIGRTLGSCYADYTAWSTSRMSDDNLALVSQEIAKAKDFAKEQGVPFRVRSCYPFIAVEGSNIIELDEANLKRLERGEPLTRKSVYPTPKGECTCPPEDLQFPSEAKLYG